MKESERLIKRYNVLRTEWLPISQKHYKMLEQMSTLKAQIEEAQRREHAERTEQACREIVGSLSPSELEKLLQLANRATR